MKIALVNDFFWPNVAGGADLFLREFCSYLKERGDQVTIITSSFVQDTGYDTIRVNSSPLPMKYMKQVPGMTISWNFDNKKLKEYLKNELSNREIDLLYVNNSYHLSFAPMQAARELGIPIILDVHDYWPICHSKDFYQNNEKICEKGQGKWCKKCLSKKYGFLAFPITRGSLENETGKKSQELGYVKKIICHSDFVSKQLSKFGLDSQVIPYPFFGDVKRGQKRENRIVFMGRLSYAKGADLILPLAQKLTERGIDYTIDVFGRGNFEKTLKNSGLNIKCHGFSGDERFETLCEASVLFAPSRWPEPFGIVALEALACGVPTLTLESSGGLRELVERERSGIVCHPDQIEQNVVDILNSGFEIGGKIENYDKNALFEEFRKVFVESCN